MIAASYFFYGWWDWRFVFLLAASTVVNQIDRARLIFRSRAAGRAQGGSSGVAVAFNLALLGYFKYYDFFVSSALRLLGAASAFASRRASSRVTLPVGISFFTFMALAYVIDIYRGDFDPVGCSIFATYLSFFPHLVAGPIVRPCELDAADGDAARPAARRRDPRVLPDRRRPVHEGRDRELPGRRGSWTRCSASPDRHSSARGARRHLRVRGADLRRLLRLHEHGDRGRAAARVPGSRRTSTTRTRPCRSRTSGGAGT